MKTIVLDLDGTLFNCDHRQHLAQAGLWDEFHALSTEDLIYEDVSTFVKFICNLDLMTSPHFRFLALTGRNEKYRSITIQKLESVGILIDDLLMRPDDNFMSDGPMKTSLLEIQFGSKDKVLENVLFCLEDRDKVVEHFRNYGLNCWQVRQGAF